MVMCMIYFDAIGPIRTRLLATFFPLLFQISIRIRKAFIFNKNEGNKQRFTIKYRVELERALLSK